MNLNTLELLHRVAWTLDEAGIHVWLCGGWAEELRQLCPPRPHNDIDLLFPAASFAVLDTFFESHPEMEEIRAKRFVHKRAAIYDGVVVEFLLVEPRQDRNITPVFGIEVFDWPEDTFTRDLSLIEGKVFVVGKGALQAYRAFHPQVERARRLAASMP